MKKVKIGISDMILLVLSIIFLVGILTFFKTCGPKNDGSWMTCHWAGNTVTGIAVILTAISFVHMLIPDRKIKIGLSVSIIPVSVLAILVPGVLINTCMADVMRCNAIMRPSVIILSSLMIVFSVFDIIRYAKKEY